MRIQSLKYIKRKVCINSSGDDTEEDDSSSLCSRTSCSLESEHEEISEQTADSILFEDR